MLSSGLPDQVGDDEDLARFLTSSGQFSSLGVKQSAFLPSPISRETSVSRHGAEPKTVLWQLGKPAAGERTLHGVAILKAASVREVGLSVVADEPPLRHAAIRNWPWPEDDPEFRKAKHKELALCLAQKSTLVLATP